VSEMLKALGFGRKRDQPLYSRPREERALYDQTEKPREERALYDQTERPREERALYDQNERDGGETLRRTPTSSKFLVSPELAARIREEIEERLARDLNEDDDDYYSARQWMFPHEQETKTIQSKFDESAHAIDSKVAERRTKELIAKATQTRKTRPEENFLLENRARACTSEYHRVLQAARDLHRRHRSEGGVEADLLVVEETSYALQMLEKEREEDRQAAINHQRELEKLHEARRGVSPVASQSRTSKWSVDGGLRRNRNRPDPVHHKAVTLFTSSQRHRMLMHAKEEEDLVRRRSEAEFRLLMARESDSSGEDEVVGSLACSRRRVWRREQRLQEIEEQRQRGRPVVPGPEPWEFAPDD